MRTLVRKCEQHKTRNFFLFASVTGVYNNGKGIIFTKGNFCCTWSQKVVIFGLVKGLLS